ncbi:glycoside hydrolase family 127 protein [Mucilaginibacter sabulilitoris]|uniref:Glycoside hydrolase family 127 protein n=1 Tax=Mucilaginibacter sabulilitoris TaxID=1173583 RepID=A0ABZ0TTS8_9SPHI|nr:beta-L-arabinofuranosidase domain-containing protein [Mucilaginibacter sabulilitoris]WPU95573.1 glycoside hydrolase family 127 protein [Mucilaginibacter sabulilitoris]
MAIIKSYRLLLLCGQLTFFSYQALAQTSNTDTHTIHPVSFQNVRIDDQFWSPKFKVWNSTTVYDVFDKLEGKYEPDRPDIIKEKEKLGRTRNAFQNFDWVAEGKKNTQQHDGPPWYDGLVYETIRGAADLLAEHPDKILEAKIDAYIARIAAAQNADPDGYINTYTTLMRPNQRWGTNGGDDKWQHDVYNSGMLMEAGVHYYKATGKTKLLNVAVKMSNYICTQMGPAPKSNVIPGHGGPEEALLKVYQLFKQQPALKKKMTIPVNENDYLAMVKFWIEDRGNYGEKDGSHARKSDSSYNQDHMPVLKQETIEGHAVRATLLATGVTATALETGDTRYANTANNYWNNMVGKRMFITGGEGAIANGERFGANYFLPESAYLETCASISSGFFSEQMNELKADGKYMDEFERVIYNNLLSGISLTGDHFFYENPLVGNGNKRWAWHDCPCCPPMILKMVGALPQYIYAYDSDHLYVNLFIGSEASFNINGTAVLLKQTTGYPWKGANKIEVTPKNTTKFAINVRIPGWAEGKENPFDLYHSKVNGGVSLKVNGQQVPVQPVKGYASITRSWKKGDVIELDLPMQPRLITTNDSVQTVKGKLALASGPIIYSFESLDNPGLKDYRLKSNASLAISYKPNLLNGINVITGKAADTSGKQVEFTAIPFYTIGNRQAGNPYQVWINEDTK